MYRLRSDRGFVKLDIREIEAIVHQMGGEQMIMCVPLATLPSHNPVYRFQTGEGVFDQLIYDVGLSPDCAGLVPIGRLKEGAIGHRLFICAQVRLWDGQEGWINLAMLNRHWLDADSWRIYFKPVVLVKCQCGQCDLSWLKHGWHCPLALEVL